jgi:ribosomal protein L12E/L44/L45/RPP1/RPP2
MTIEDFGARVVSVWQGLRPSTRNLVVRALTTTTPVPQTTAAAANASRTDAAYDARSEWELSRLLAALDERADEKTGARLSDEQSRDLLRIAETCASVLQRQARSAEVFSQLLSRAVRAKDYTRVDALADVMTARLVPSELSEMARDPNPSVRAVAQEALLQLPTSTLVSLLGDPVDADTARSALEAQAVEYDSEEARIIVHALEQVEEDEEDF